MNVISQYLGYSFRLLSFILGVYLALIALDVACVRYGVWGYIVGLLTLPLAVPAALVYQAFTEGKWIDLIGLFIGMPLLWIVGSALVRRGRR